MRIKLLFISLLMLLCASVNAEVELAITGLKGKTKDNVEAHLSSISKDDYSTTLRFQSRLRESITGALNALGYYHPQITFSVTNDGDDELLTINVKQGKRTKIKEVDVVISGEASTDHDFSRVLRRSKIKEGVSLNHDQYEDLKSSIRQLALYKGYFNGEFKVQRLEVVPETNEAFVRIHYDSGIRYNFGEVTVVGSQIEADRMNSLQPYQPGQPYLVSLIGEHNQNLSNSGWFSSVFVEPDLSKLDENRDLPITVSLVPQMRNQLETGIGYATDVGVRGSLKWKKPWINRRGHSFDSSFSISKPEQVIMAGYTVPLENVLRDYYRIEYGLKNVDNRDTRSLESQFAVERHWLLDNNWHRVLFVRYLIETYEQGLQDDTGQFLLPGITYTRIRSRGRSMPHWGDKQSVTLEYGDPNIISETHVLRLLADSTWIRSSGRNHRGLLGLSAGANFADEFDKLSPSLRFFAGGDNSIRGYRYESISPKDASDSLTGAQYFMTSSLEYQYRLTGDWWGAMFVDYGDAFNSSPDWKTGVGAGIRWGSPVGPIRLDFAWGLDSNPGDEFRIHFALGSEL